MAEHKLEGVTIGWDAGAMARGEPGIYNSYMAALAGVLRYLGTPTDPAWLMGASGWAFRICVHEALCPSATSVYDWGGILPEAVAQVGYQGVHIHGDYSSAGRQRAHAAIVAGLAAGVPAIVWDVDLPEWGLVVGHDADKAHYLTLNGLGRPGTMPYEQLGQREIPLLSVTVLGAPGGRSREQVVRRAMELAVGHGAGQEWTERPAYENGLAAYALWADALEHGLCHAEGVPSGYYAGHYAGARCYARDFLKALAAEDATLAPAAEAYTQVAAELMPVWRAYAQGNPPPEVARVCASHLRRAQAAEERGLALLAGWLQES